MIQKHSMLLILQYPLSIKKYMRMRTFNKVAAVTLLFWLMKIVATTLGETLGDFISMTLNLGYVAGIVITLVFFIIILSVQLSIKKYIPAIYWMVIIGTTTLGTEISDFIDRTLKTGYLTGSLILLSGLLLSLFLWYKKYGNLEVYPISERNKELYYWTAILFSNSLGTAFGDFLSDNLGLGYMTGALITGLIILAVVLLHYFTKINHVLLFWIAFVFTRPFGATFGDLLTKPLVKGGLDLGTLNASLISLTLMVMMIIISQRKHTRELPSIENKS
ncbi:COG4705 family protein [Chryseobacterium gleum]|uniref:COG4705 family protein n=1 Tax=Chryseobacterium gleum TaxID=250 RepID=UPI0028A7CA68|nr:hypothetical protein [Chryseobacterium gleum]